MQKTKVKHGSPVTGSRTRFVALWVLIYFIGMFINQAFHATNPARYLTVDQANIISLTLTMIPVLLQVQMIERLYKHSMRGWLAVNMLGIFVTLLINPWAWSMTGNSDVRYFLNVAAIIVPPLLFQTVWMWRHVKFAWMWLTLRLARWMLWIPIGHFFPTISDTVLVWVLMVLELIIEGAVMHTLLAHPKDSEKAKIDQAADEHSNAHHERLNRLQERERSNPLWDTGDEQTLQSEA